MLVGQVMKNPFDAPTYTMKARTYRDSWIIPTSRMLLGIILGLILVPCLHAQELSLTPSPTGSQASAPPAESEADMLKESFQDLKSGNLDAALDKANQIIKLNSQNKDALLLRASIYARQKQWDKADYDYQLALLHDPNNVIVKFDQAELKFMQQKYDDARTGFEQVQSDKVLGDIATYKVFLCDLFGSHEAQAAKELDVFNQEGGNPSYYFGNAAWDLVHHDEPGAASWLKSALYIYSNKPQMISNYIASLKSLGYLPLRLSSTK